MRELITNRIKELNASIEYCEAKHLVGNAMTLAAIRDELEELLEKLTTSEHEAYRKGYNEGKIEGKLEAQLNK